MILARVSPVTHSVANCVKRVVVIVSSVLFFRTPISPVNALGKNKLITLQPLSTAVSCGSSDLFLLVTAGTGAALAGVYLYSRLKKAKPKSS